MRPLTRREFLRFAALAAAAGPAALGCRRTARREVNFFSWANYLGEKTLPGFEAETGIAVNYEVYADEEEMFSKLKAGVQGYDLIVVTDYMIPRLAKLGMIDPVPHERLPNLSHLAPRFADPAYDRGLRYSVPYLWGTTGIGYDRTKVAAPPSSWRALWDERYADRMSMLDNARDAIGCTLLMEGLPVDAKDPKVLGKAREVLLRQKKLLKHYSSATYIDELVAGELWLAQAWNGDVLGAQKDNPRLDYVVPREGSFIWVDALALVRGSEHRAETLAFVDYLLRPEVAAETSDFRRFATPNADALPRLASAVREDPRVFPPLAASKRLSFYPVLDAETDELWNRTWQDVKVL